MQAEGQLTKIDQIETYETFLLLSLIPEFRNCVNK